MNPLTQEQVNIAKTFTDDQKNSYSQLRTNGVPIQEAFTIVANAYANKPKEDKTLIEGLGGAVKEALTGGIRRTGEIAEKYGASEAVSRLPLSITAGLGAGFGQAVGAVLETADDITGEVISGAIQPTLEKAVTSPTGQRIIQGLSQFNEQTRGVAGDVLDASNLIGLGSLKSSPAKALRQNITSKIKTGVSKVTEPIKGKSLKEVLRKPFTKSVEVPETVISPVTFSEAVSRGFTPQEARVFANLSVKDKPIASDMLKLADDISLGKADVTTRPIDLVGKNVKTRLNSLETIEKNLGGKVDDAAKSLEKLPINNEELQSSFINTIDDYKIKRTDKGWDFSESDFALTKNVQGDIERALSYVFSKKPDAYAVHRIKKTLDGLLYPQKTAEGLSGKAKSLIQQLRRNADDYLDNNFQAYRTANEEFSQVKNTLDSARDILGDFNEANLAQKIRQTFSNSGKREELKVALKNIDDLAKTKGLEDIGNIYNQALFAEKLIDIFGDQAVTGFGESIKRAVSRAQAVAQGLRNPIQGIGSVAGEVVETIAGQRPIDRIEFLRNLLK